MTTDDRSSHLLNSAMIVFASASLAVVTAIATPGGWFGGLMVGIMGASWAWMEATQP